MLTAAQKLQRKAIFDHYKDQINKVCEFIVFLGVFHCV